MRCRGSTSTPRASPSTSTASGSSPHRPPNCRWPSSTRCSEPPMRPVPVSAPRPPGQVAPDARDTPGVTGVSRAFDATQRGGRAARVLEMLLADARLPGGGHTQSAGLEAALLAGMPIHDVPDYLRTRLATVVMVEAGTAVVARAVCAADPFRAETLADVDRAWRARVLSPALRSASLQLGRGYARLVGRVWPGVWADALTRALPV